MTSTEEPRRPDGQSTLSLRGITKQYGQTPVLNGIDTEIRPGEVVALLGENGAGKSTLANIIGGVVPPSGGEMFWRGERYLPESPGDAIASGIGLIHQELRLIPELSVAENVWLGRLPTRQGFLDRRAMVRRSKEVLDQLGFRGSLSQNVGSLSVASQQLVEIAKALLLQPSFLILDEPTAALGDDETQALFARIGELRDRGVGFIYVSHRLSEIAQIADRVLVLRDGQLISEYDRDRIDPEVLIQDMVGRPISRLYPTVKPATDRPLLDVSGITDRHGRFENVSFTLHAGEILGIAGIVGAGRTELLRSVASLEPRQAGTVTLDGSPVPANKPREALRRGIALIPEDRAQQGLLLDDTAERNVVLSTLARDRRYGFLNRRALTRRSRQAIAAVGVRGDTTEPVNRLSGGNQQKVVIGKALESDPDVILLDEPTRGIDVGARAAIYELIAQLAERGKGVILVSSDLEEVVGLSHRVLVLADGQQKGVLEGSDISPGNIMTLAV